MPERTRNPDATQFARDQRATANEFAQNVWQMLRSRRCCGEKFRREHSIEPFMVDFCCVELKLVVEVDGKEHFTEEGLARDRSRDKYLEDLGYKILRFPGYEVMQDPRQVFRTIETAIVARRNSKSNSAPSSPALLPRKAGGEGSGKLGCNDLNE